MRRNAFGTDSGRHKHRVRLYRRGLPWHNLIGTAVLHDAHDLLVQGGGHGDHARQLKFVSCRSFEFSHQLQTKCHRHDLVVHRYALVPLLTHISSIRQHTAAYGSIRRQHTSAYVSIRQHTSAYVSRRQHADEDSHVREALQSSTPR